MKNILGHMQKVAAVAVVAFAALGGLMFAGKGWVPSGYAAGGQSAEQVAAYVFGTPVPGHPTIFCLSKDFALRLKTDESGQATRIEALPKYDLRDIVPGWEDLDERPVLSDAEYRDALAKISKIRAVGVFLGSDGNGPVLNGNFWLLDQYSNAFIDRGAKPPQEEDEGSTAQVFTIYYIRQVDGVVGDRHRTDTFGRPHFQVEINDCLYFTTAREFARAKTGHRMALRVAGPTDFATCQ